MVTYSYDILTAGRNIGCHHFRDPANPQYAYHLRETNDASEFVLVKIDVTTGDVIQTGGNWASPGYGAFGACFTNTSIQPATNITGGMSSGSKLYLAAPNEVSASHWNSVIVEFDKSTLAVTNHWTNGTNETQTRTTGTSVMNAAGTIFANGSVQTIGGSGVSNSRIQLLKPSNSAYGYIDILAQTGEVIGNMQSNFNSPLCFDNSGFLWIVTYPKTFVTSADYVSGKSNLRKFSVVDDGMGALTLTEVDSFQIQDDFHAYGTSTFAQTYHFMRISYNLATNSIYTWSGSGPAFASEMTEGWFFEFDLDSETFTREGISFTPGTGSSQQAPYDLVGWIGGVDSFITMKEAIAGTPTYCLFKISDGTLTEYPIVSTWTYSDSQKNPYSGWTSVYSNNSFEIYAFDEGYSHFTTYTDAIFFAESPAPPAIPRASVKWI